MPVLDALGIFDPIRIRNVPEEELGSFGNDELAMLTEAMAEKSLGSQTVLALVHQDEAEQDWAALKAMVSTVPYLFDCKPVQSLAEALHANSSRTDL